MMIDGKIHQELDLNENRGFLCCSPDFLLDMKDFTDHIKIGIQTKGFEQFKGNNLLLCIGFLGKMGRSSNTRYRFESWWCSRNVRK